MHVGDVYALFVRELSAGDDLANDVAFAKLGYCQLYFAVIDENFLSYADFLG